MPRVYVEFGQLKQFGNDYRSISSMIDGIKSAFQSTVGALDWDVQYMSDIKSTADQLTRKMDNYVQALKNYQSFLYEASDKYSRLEGGDNSSSMNSVMGGAPLIGTAVVGTGASLRGPEIQHEIHAYVEPQPSAKGVSSQDVTRGLAEGLAGELLESGLLGETLTIPGAGIVIGVAVGIGKVVEAGMDKYNQGASTQEIAVEVVSEAVYQGLKIGATVAVGAAIGGMVSGPLAPVGVVVGAVVGVAVGLIMDATIREPVKAAVTSVGNAVVSGAKAVVNFFKKW